ncbi:MAG: alanine racemase [Nocardioidaceae bacterium]
MLTLYVDRGRFLQHLASVVETFPGIVPVAKGNGYGFGVGLLASLAQGLDADTLAVGTYDELASTADFDGSLLVLTPWRPFEQTDYLDDPRVIHTVGRLEDLRDLAARASQPRVVLERMTSMLRHGFTARGLREAGDLLAEARAPTDLSTDPGAEDEGVRVEGVALHLPMARGSHLAEVERLLTDVVASGIDTKCVYVSHLGADELRALGERWPDFTFRPRIGTQLWLGDREALSVRATVLDVHEVQRGDVFGYRGRSAPKHGSIVVVSGGTAHGIGLEAPGANTSLRDRAAAVARGGLDAAGFVRSPFTIAGKQRLFAEPPHMQASMLFVPSGVPIPEVGDEIDVRVRFTATSFDQITFL